MAAVCQCCAVIVVRILVAVLGASLAIWTLASAVKTVVLPRASSSVLTRAIFIGMRRLFDLAAPAKRSFEVRDRVLALYAPLSLLALPVMWVALVLVGFSGLFWGMNVNPYSEAFLVSGSSLLTLGFDRPTGMARQIVAFSEAGIGLGVVSLMISYLPSIYSNFSRREALVGMLEVRAGLPPSPSVLLVRYQRIGWGDRVAEDLFERWEAWFIDVEESHTSQPSLVFFRSPHPERSWITAAGCVLDIAALATSTLDSEHDARADVLLRTGFFCLRRICNYYQLPYPRDPAPGDPISITREEYDEVCAELEAAGIGLKPDRDQAWRDFAGWRVNYDAALLGLCTLVVAPPSKWSSDRSMLRNVRPKLFRRQPRFGES